MKQKRINKLIDDLLNEEIGKLRGGDIGDDAQSALSYIATKNPISKALYEPLKGIADAFSASQSKLLDSAKAREAGIDIFHDDEALSPDDPLVTKFGILPEEQYIYYQNTVNHRRLPDVINDPEVRHLGLTLKNLNSPAWQHLNNSLIALARAHNHC